MFSYKTAVHNKYIFEPSNTAKMFGKMFRNTAKMFIRHSHVTTRMFDKFILFLKLDLSISMVSTNHLFDVKPNKKSHLVCICYLLRNINFILCT